MSIYCIKSILQVVPPEDALTPTEESLDLLQHITRNDVQEVFGSTLSEMLPHVQVNLKMFSINKTFYLKKQ